MPLKSLILAITILFIFTATHTCNASESQNKTLSEVSSYNFTKGIYNVVQYAESDKANFRIIFETEIPYLNISFLAPSDGYLDIYLEPLIGPVPYIELDKYWEIKSLTYSRTLEKDEITHFYLTPPLIFSSSNFSRVVSGGITIWELYEWPNLSGLINYTFTPTDEITFDLIYYPVHPRQGEEISLFTESNAKISNITWQIIGENIDWENNSYVLEIESLDEGTYTVYVSGHDEFNTSHTAQTQIVVIPPIFEAAFLDLSLFSVDYPESVNLGDPIPLTATVDYSLSDPTEIKIILEDRQNGDEYTEINNILSGNGSTQLASNLEAMESGVMKLNLRMFYSKGDEWIELADAVRQVSITVNDVVEPQTLPDFRELLNVPLVIIRGLDLSSLLIGIVLILSVNFIRSRK